MSEYTPTTGKVRLRYVAMRNQATGDGIPENAAEFDRWLAAHDEQTRADERRRIIAEIQASDLGAPIQLDPSSGTARFLTGPELRERICAFIEQGDNQ